VYGQKQKLVALGVNSTIAWFRLVLDVVNNFILAVFILERVVTNVANKSPD